MLISEKGMIVRSPVKDIRTTGRSTQGVRLIKLDAGDVLSSVAKIVPEEEEVEKIVSIAPAAAPAVQATETVESLEADEDAEIIADAKALAEIAEDTAEKPVAKTAPKKESPKKTPAKKTKRKQ
jgi:DNA gyrase/topoisomerase IV subunit A